MYNYSNGAVGGSAKWMFFALPPLSHGSFALLAPVRAAETWHTHQAGVVTQEHTAQAYRRKYMSARRVRGPHTHRHTGWPARCDARSRRRAKTAADPVAVATRANRARHLSACVHVSTHAGACVCLLPDRVLEDGVKMLNSSTWNAWEFLQQQRWYWRWSWRAPLPGVEWSGVKWSAVWVRGVPWPAKRGLASWSVPSAALWLMGRKVGWGGEGEEEGGCVDGQRSTWDRA